MFLRLPEILILVLLVMFLVVAFIVISIVLALLRRTPPFSGGRPKS